MYVYVHVRAIEAVNTAQAMNNGLGLYVVDFTPIGQGRPKQDLASAHCGPPPGRLCRRVADARGVHHEQRSRHWRDGFEAYRRAEPRLPCLATGDGQSVHPRETAAENGSGWVLDIDPQRAGCHRNSGIPP